MFRCSYSNRTDSAAHKSPYLSNPSRAVTSHGRMDPTEMSTITCHLSAAPKFCLTRSVRVINSCFFLFYVRYRRTFRYYPEGACIHASFVQSVRGFFFVCLAFHPSRWQVAVLFCSVQSMYFFIFLVHELKHNRQCLPFIGDALRREVLRPKKNAGQPLRCGLQTLEIGVRSRVLCTDLDLSLGVVPIFGN